MARDKVFRPLRDNLRTGLRIGFFRPFDPDTLQVDTRQVVLLVIVGLGIRFLLDYANVASHQTFDKWGLLIEFSKYALFFFILYLVTQIHGKLERFGLFATAMLATAPIGGLWYEASRVIVRHSSAGSYILLKVALVATALIWILGVVYRVQRRVFVGRRWRTITGTAAYLALAIATTAWLPPIRMWHHAYSQDDYRPPIDVEQTYYAQPALLNAELSRLKPQRPGIHDIYFVGVAGYANQNVFLHEVRSIRKLFDTRYGTAGRSILLVNNPATVKTLPLANASNLKIVLDRIGKLMNPKEDMLFLYITSHGSEDKTIAFNYWPLSLDDLTARKLHDILSGSHIGWRTVVLSSCYSGGFIDSLKNPDALVMTAAAANRTSFGCSNENAWTYFGDAYFHHALAHSPDFIKAFEQARVAIARREAREKLTPSNPQIWVGSRIANFLPQVETHMAALSAMNSPSVSDCYGGQRTVQSRCRQ